MTIHVRSRRRVALLLACMTLILGGVLGAYHFREAARDREATESRVRGMRALSAGQWVTAERELRRFITRLDPDPDALVAHARAILNRPGVDDQHRRGALVSLRRAVRMRPDHLESSTMLLKLYGHLGMATEAYDLATRILAIHPQDDAALLAQLRMLMQRGEYEKAEREIITPKVPVSRPFLAAQLLTLNVLSLGGATDADVMARAEAVVAAQPQNPRIRVVVARALILAERITEARAALLQLLETVEVDAEFARDLIPDLDAAGLPARSLGILRDLPPSSLDSSLRLELVRRLFEADRYAEVVEAVRGWHSPASHLSTPILGHLVLAHARVGDTSAGVDAEAALAERESVPAAVAWMRLAKAERSSPALSLAGRLEVGLAAIGSDASNAHAHYFLGLAYRDAGEPELALRELTAASRLSRGWSRPAATAVGVLMRAGRLQAALRAAEAADSLASEEPGVVLMLALARWAGSSATPTGASDHLLGQLERMGGDFAPMRLAVLARSGTDDQVRELIEGALNSSPPPRGGFLVAAGEISTARGLALERRCWELHLEHHGVTPALALSRARLAASSGSPDAALALFAQLRERSDTGATAAWFAAQARLLEDHARIEQARDSWRTATMSEGAGPAELSGALSSSVVWADRDLVASTIRQLRAATHDTCLTWRVHHARWLLEADPPAPDALEEATALLRMVSAAAPSRVAPRLLLARALELAGDVQGAIDQLILVRSVIGRSVNLDLRVSKLHLDARNWALARDLIQRLVDRTGSTEPVFDQPRGTMLASMLAQLGERELALRVLNQLPKEDAEFLMVQRWAELYAGLGDYERARELSGRVLSSPNPTPRATLLAASLAFLDGRFGDEVRLLDTLSASVPDARKRDRMLGEHFESTGRYRQAEGHWLSAASGAGGQLDDWRRLLACQVLSGRVESVRTTLESITTLTMDSPVLTIETELVLLATARPGLRQLGGLYARGGKHAASARAALTQLAKREPSMLEHGDVLKLRGIAASNVFVLPIQMAVIHYLAAGGQHEAAVELAESASENFPTSVEPPRALTISYRALGRAQESLAAMKAWEQRAMVPSTELSILRAQTESPTEAVRRLRRLLEGEQEADSHALLLAYGRACIAAGVREELEQRYRARLKSSDVVPLVWCELAQFLVQRNELAAAMEWLDEDALATRAADLPELALYRAVAWHDVHRAGSSDTALRHLRAALNDTAEFSDWSGAQWETIGLLERVVGDSARARHAYREALAREPGRSVSLNNLALLLVEEGDTAAALRTARQLVEGRGRHAEFRDTLARVYRAAGELEAALREWEECQRLEPRNASWGIAVLDALLALDRRSTAKTRLKAFRRVYPVDEFVPGLKRQWMDVVRRVRAAD